MKRFSSYFCGLLFVLASAINAFAQAQITVSSVTPRLDTYEPSDIVTVDVVISNEGDAPAGAFDVTLSLVGPEGNPWPVASLTTNVGGLADGAETLVVFSDATNTRLKLDIPNGQYTLQATAVASSMSGSFSVNTKPDLQIIDLNYDTGVWEAGDILHFDITYRNNESFGSVETLRVDREQSYTIEVVLSTDNVFGNEDDFLLTSIPLWGNPTLGGNLLPFITDTTDSFYDANQEINLAWSQAIPRNFFGDYFVLAKIDVDDHYDEYVEDIPAYNGNNVWYATETAKISIVPSENPEATTFQASLKADGTEGDGMSEKPSLSTDGRYVAFSTLSQLVEEDTDAFFDIYVRDNLTGEVELVSRSLDFPAEDGDNINPAISADGRYVVFTSEAANLITGDSNEQRDIFRTDLVTGETELVSRAAGATGAIANGASALPDISDDGSKVSFQTTATNLGGVLNASLNLYVRDFSDDSLTLVSLATSGDGANGDSFDAKLSGDGNYLVFTSEATDLVAGGTTTQNIFRVAVDGTGMLLVSEDGGGTEGDRDSFEAAIDFDGNTIVYATRAQNLGLPGGVPFVDADDLSEIIVTELDNGTNSVTSVSRLVGYNDAHFNDQTLGVGETPARTGARDPDISGDGSRVVFRTQSNNLLPTTLTRSDNEDWDLNGGDPRAVGYMDLNSTNTSAFEVSDIYLFDRTSSSYALASVNRFGYQGAVVEHALADGSTTINVPSVRDAVISANGRYVAFSSDGLDAYGFSHERTNRISEDQNEVRDVFIHDFRTSAELVETDPPAFVTFNVPPSLLVSETAVIEFEVDPDGASDPNAPRSFVEEVRLFIDSKLVSTTAAGDGFYQWTPTQPGVYLVQAIATDNDGFSIGSEVRIVTVSSGVAPTVSFLTPADNDPPLGEADFTVPYDVEQILQVSANPAASSGSPISRVEFFVDGQSIGVDSSAPYLASWTPVGAGGYRLVAVATDLSGRQGTTGVLLVSATDPQPPTVALVSPNPFDGPDPDTVADAKLLRGQAIDISASVNQGDYALQSVTFTLNGVPLGAGIYNSANGRFEYPYTPTVIGNIALGVVVTDTKGNTDTDARTFEVEASTPPSITITAPDTTDTSPADGVADNELRQGERVQFRARATTGSGAISNVEFFANGISLGLGTYVSNSGYYALDYTIAQGATFTLKATATDVFGNQASATLDYQVAAAIPSSDLQITGIAIEDTALYPGSEFSVEVSFLNAGPEDVSDDFTVELFLDAPTGGTDQTASAVYTASATTLDAGSSDSVVLTIKVPFDNPGGDFTLYAMVDSTAVIYEAGLEANNIGSVDLTVEDAGLPDLVISDMSYETGTWTGGDILNFSLTYHLEPSSDGIPAGRITTEESYEIWVVLSSDLVYGNEDDFLLYATRLAGNGDSANPDSLLPYDGTDASQLITINWAQAMPKNFYGDYFVLAKIDDKDDIEEAVEDDPGLLGNNVYYAWEAPKISLRPASTPQATTYRASLQSDGTEGAALSEEPDLSGDGRYLVFSSMAQLSGEDTDDFYDVYLRDNLSGEVTLLSKSNVLSGADGDSRFPRISADGAFVVFASESSQLAAGDGNGLSDVFVLERSSGLVRNITMGANGDSSLPDLSDDGNLIVFQSNATNLTGDALTVGDSRVFAYDYTTEVVTLLSTASGGGEPNGGSFEPRVSGDGAFAVFSSDAMDLVAGGTTGRQVFRVATDGSATLLVSEDGLGNEADGVSFNPAINEDGSVVAFASEATNIDSPLGGDTDGLPEIFVVDIAGGAVAGIERLLTSAGTQFAIIDASTETAPAIGAVAPSLSADGQRVVFQTQANNLLPTTITRFDGQVWDEANGAAIGYTDTNSVSLNRAPASDIYLYDRTADAYEMASVNKFGFPAPVFLLSLNEDPFMPSLPSSEGAVISGDGRYVAFASDGRGQFGFDHLRTNQLTEDYNDVRDVFIHDFRTGSVPVAVDPPSSVTVSSTAVTGFVGDTILISANAVDVGDGYITELGLYRNGTLLETFLHSGFVQWVPTQAGIYTFQAIATDNDGNSLASAPTTVTIADATGPTVTIDTPADGDTIYALETQTFAVTVLPNGSSSSAITQVDFFVNGNLLGSDTASPYEASWTPNGPGNYVLTAVATDVAGQTGISVPATITVEDPSAPFIDGPTLTPAGGEDLVIGVPTILSIRASDDEGIAQVEFFINGASIGIATQASTFGTYELEYTPTLQGSNIPVEVVVRDINGRESRFAETYNFILGENPDVTWTGPALPLKTGEAVTLSATATDDDGSITSVIFTLNGVQIGAGAFNAVTGDYEYSWTPDFTGTVTLAAVATDDSGNVVSATANYTVSENPAPVIANILPTDASSLVRGQTVTLSADVSDDGAVAAVEFWVNGGLLGVGQELTSFGTYELEFTPVLTGSFSVEVRATDDEGAESTETVSYTVNVAVGNAPTVGLINPVDGRSYWTSQTITLAAVANDIDGNVTGVEFFANDVFLGVDTTAPFVAQLTPPNAGQYVLEAVATDNDGLEASSLITITVSDPAAPVVTVIAPASGDLLTDVETEFVASVIGSANSIETVEFYGNGRLLGEGTVQNGLWRLPYTPTAVGTLAIEALAYDSSSNPYPSTVVDYTVVAGDPPVISNILPIDGSTMVRAAPITLSARVDDPDGSILSVQVYANGALLGNASQDTTFGIYELDYAPPLLGNLEIVYVATDDTGNITTALADYTVESSVGTSPSVQITAPDPTDLDNDDFADTTLGVNVPTTITANASDPDGTVDSVEFFVNGVSLGDANAQGGGVYSLAFTPSFAGDIVITALVTDNFGNVDFDSVNYSVITGDAPTISIVSPPSDGTYLPGTQLPVQALAYDGDGLVQRVEFYLNGQLIASSGTSPYRAFISLPAAGPHVFHARAVDNDNNATVSPAVIITGGPIDGVTPRAYMSHPLPLGGGDVVNDASVPSETWINVTVDDPDAEGVSEIVAVRFFVNGQLIDTVTEGVGNVFATFLDFNATGAFVLFAEAEDVDGNVGQAIPIALDVVDFQAPMPTINVRPILPRSPIGEPVDLFAEVDGGLLAIDRVDFFADGVLIGSSVTPQGADGKLFAISWVPRYTGDFDITARAVQIDANGLAPDNWRISTDDVSIQITDAPVTTPPSVSLLYPTAEQIFAVDSRVLIQAGATDPNGGGISSIEFYIEDNSAATPVISGTDSTWPYTFAWTPSVPGQYRINAIANDVDGDYSRSATLVVNVVSASGGPPTVEIVSPNPIDLDNDGIADSQIKVNTPTTLGIEVSGAEHPIDSVTLFSNGNAIGEATKVPAPGLYELSWTPSLVGPYSITAAVRDIRGNETFATLVYDVVTVAPPNVAILNPADGLVVTVGNTFVVQATASDVSGSVDFVEFFANDVLIGADNTYPYNISYRPTSLGVVRLVARATNSSGVTRLSDPVLVTVTANGPTSITIQNPINGGSYPVGNQIPLIANVTTAGSGSSLAVQFYVNGDAVGEPDTAAPFRLVWTPTSPGDYDIGATVVETVSGASASANEVSISVTASTAPVFSALGPVTPNPTTGSDVQLQALVSDPDGFVESVRFSVNGKEIAIDESEPFTVFWTPTAAGTYTIEAEAQDNAGNITFYSQPVSVSNPIGQVPTLTLSLTGGGNVTPGSRIMVSASVIDDDPDGVSVTFFMNGSQVGETDTEAPYAVVMEPEVGLPLGAYFVTALATDSDGNSRARTLSPLYVSDFASDQPGVTIVTPEMGDLFTMGSRASLRAKVTGGAAQNVASVVFYANGIQVGQDSTAPYAIDWIPDQEGEVVITAAALQNTRLYDIDGIATTTDDLIDVTPVTLSNQVTVQSNPAVGKLPSVSFQILPGADKVAQGSTVMLYADAQDLDGSVASVEFFLDGVSLGAPDTSRPFSYVWTAANEGEFFVNAVATDNEGNVVNSNFIPIEVSPRVVTTSPTVSLSVPGTAQAGDFITLRSSVRDFVTGPEGVDFYINGQMVGTVAVRPFNFIWEANLEGVVSVFAVAQQELSDGSIVSAASATQVISLAEDENPVIGSFTYTFPGQGASKTKPLVNEKLSFTVTASDNGRVETLELLRNNLTVKTISNPTFPVIIDDLPPGLGSYTYAVVVTDNSGRQVQTSGASNLVIEVVAGAAPTAVIISPSNDDKFLPNETITMRANATDSDGKVTSVQFYVNGVEQGAPATTAPYERSFTPSAAGSYSLTVRATDNSGNVSNVSTPVVVSVINDDAPEFIVFSVNLPGEDPLYARVNQAFTIDVSVVDDQAVQQLSLFRNTTKMPNPGGVEVPLQYSDVLTVPGQYRYRAEATDTGNNVGSSKTIAVQAILGSKPEVAITAPLNNAEVEAGSPVAIRAMATPADEPVGPMGSVSKVEFFANGNSFAVKTAPPYVADFTPMSEGDWELTVVATSDTGVVSDPDKITLSAIDGSVPVVSSFTSDAANNRALLGSTITFNVELEATDVAIDRVSVVDVDGQVLGTSVAAPYRITYRPMEPGNYTFYARATNVDNQSGTSEQLTINIYMLDPTESSSDFVYQTFIDLLGRKPSDAELAAEQVNFDPDLSLDQQTADESLVLQLVESDEFEAMRSAVYARYLLGGKWPTRAEVEHDLAVILDRAGTGFDDPQLTNSAKANAVIGVVQALLPAFETLYVEELVPGATGLPDAFSDRTEIETFVSELWKLKYGVPPTSTNRFATTFRQYGLEGFVARFILDIGNIVNPTSGAAITPIFAFQNPPNDNAFDWANSAAMLINLLRIQPSQDEVEALAQELRFTRAALVIADSRYAARFETAFTTLQHRKNGWKYSEWFGWFYPHESGSGWNYSIEQGWVYFHLTGQSESSFWYYDPGTGWTWTNTDVFPALYSAREGGWLRSGRFAYVPGNPRWFYSYIEDEWIKR